MSSVFKNEGEGLYLFGLQYFKRSFEVKLGDIGNKIAIFLILLNKFLLIFKLVLDDASSPNGADRVEEGVLPPLLLHFRINLRE
jgi:hypothetical protein